MKKYFCLLLLVFIVASCTEDVRFNTPAFQGLNNNVFWRAKSYSAYNRTGSFVIEGQLGAEIVTFRLPSREPATYILGVDDIKTASCSNIFSNTSPEFTTGANKGSGQIVITEYDTQNQTVSGTFRFNAVNVTEGNPEKPSVTFTEGVFYKIPITPNLEY